MDGVTLPATDRVIYVFGHTNDPDQGGFADENSFREYIESGIFNPSRQGRYGYTQSRPNATKIVLSRGGVAYGHFEVSGSEAPTELDRAAFPRVRWVYLVSSSTVYECPVVLKELDIKVDSFPSTISEHQFGEIVGRAGHCTVHTPT